MQGHVLIMVGHVVNGIHDWLVIQVVAIGTRSHDLMAFLTCCWPVNGCRAWTSTTVVSAASICSSVQHPFVPQCSIHLFLSAASICSSVQHPFVPQCSIHLFLSAASICSCARVSLVLPLRSLPFCLRRPEWLGIDIIRLELDLASANVSLVISASCYCVGYTYFCAG